MTNHTDARSVEPPVLWTRGQGCGELAGVLGNPVRASGDLITACLEHRPHLLVSRKLPGSFDLVSVAVPLEFEADRVGAVVAAVAGGPHSMLAASIARRLAVSLGVDAFGMYLHRPDPSSLAGAQRVAQNLTVQTGLPVRLVEGSEIPNLVAQVPDKSLLVFGAPGGALFRRLLFGPGARLRAKAPAGAVMVRRSEDRVFHRMQPPVFVSPLREAGDTLRVHPEETLAVVDNGRLVGVVRRAALLRLDGSAAVQTVMEPAVSLRIDQPLSAALALRDLFGPDPIPVTDQEGRLLGCLAPQAPNSDVA
jgi:hypothetical protein